MRVLVVDDETAVRESLERPLRFAGYEVAQAHDGAETLEAVAGARLDLLILDVVMPWMDGLKAYRRLRARGDDLPVLMFTARNQLADRMNGLDVGADDYLVKPFTLKKLCTRLRALRDMGASRSDRGVRPTLLNRRTCGRGTAVTCTT